MRADEYVPTTGRVRDRYAYARGLEGDPGLGAAEFDRWLAARDAEVAASELDSLADDLDKDAAEEAARCRVADVRCLDCNLRYEERQEYGCQESGRRHYYDDQDMLEAAKVTIEPTYDAEGIRSRAARLRGRG